MNQNTCFIVLAPKTDQYWTKYNHKLSLKFNNEYLIDHQIKNIFANYAKANIIVAGDFHGMKLKKTNRVKYVQMSFDECTNIGGVLMELASRIKNTSICIINISLIMNIAYLKSMNINKTCMISSQNKKFESKIGCVTKNEQAHIESIFYDLDNKLCEMLYIHSRDIPSFKNILTNEVKRYMYLFEIVNILTRDMDIVLYTTKANAMHLDNYHKMIQAKRLISYINKKGTNVSI